MTDGWQGIINACLNPQRCGPITGTVWTPAGHWSGVIRDHGHCIGVWDDTSKHMTWVDRNQVTAITVDPKP